MTEKTPTGCLMAQRRGLSRVFSVGNTRAAGLWPFVNFIANCGFCCHVSLWCCADEKAQCAVVDILCSIIFTEALRSCFARQVDSVAIIGCDFVLHFLASWRFCCKTDLKLKNPNGRECLLESNQCFAIYYLSPRCCALL